MFSCPSISYDECAMFGKLTFMIDTKMTALKTSWYPHQIICKLSTLAWTYILFSFNGKAIRLQIFTIPCHSQNHQTVYIINLIFNFLSLLWITSVLNARVPFLSYSFLLLNCVACDIDLFQYLPVYFLFIFLYYNSLREMYSNRWSILWTHEHMSTFTAFAWPSSMGSNANCCHLLDSLLWCTLASICRESDTDNQLNAATVTIDLNDNMLSGYFCFLFVSHFIQHTLTLNRRMCGDEENGCNKAKGDTAIGTQLTVYHNLRCVLFWLVIWSACSYYRSNCAHIDNFYSLPMFVCRQPLLSFTNWLSPLPCIIFHFFSQKCIFYFF